MTINDSGIATKAGLDEVFFQAYDAEVQPDQVQATDELFFRQKTTQWGAIQNAEFAGPDDFQPTVTDEEVPEGNLRIGNKQTVEVLDFNQDVPFPQSFLEDSEKYEIKMGAVEEMGISAVNARDKYAFFNTYGNPFDSTNNPTPDGVALASNSHLSLNGETIDNLETGVLSADNLKINVRSLKLQKRQGGGRGGYFFNGIMVALNLLETAVEITDSELKTGSSNNNLNWVSNLYPGVRVGTSEYLSSTYNNLNTNVDTTFAVVSRRHKLTRSVRVPISTEWVDPIYDRKRRAFYRGRFRERTYSGTWSGCVFSNGTV